MHLDVPFENQLRVGPPGTDVFHVERRLSQRPVNAAPKRAGNALFAPQLLGPRRSTRGFP